jgi:hypothetical protein
MSEHCEHCTDSCDLYFDISDRLHTSGKSSWASDHCPYCDERAAIVAWLRGKYWPAAEAIERGAHLDGEE